MLADMDDRLGAPDLVQPAVEAEVVMSGRQVGRVVHGDRVLTEPPRWLDADEHPAQVEYPRTQDPYPNPCLARRSARLRVRDPSDPTTDRLRPSGSPANQVQ